MGDIKLTMVGLTEREQYLLVMMKWIDAHGGWDLKPGRLTIDLDAKGLITHFNISQTWNGCEGLQSMA